MPTRRGSMFSWHTRLYVLLKGHSNHHADRQPGGASGWTGKGRAGARVRRDQLGPGWGKELLREGGHGGGKRRER